MSFSLGGTSSPGNRIGELGLIEIGLDIIQVVVEQGQGFFFKGDKEGFLHIGAGNFVVFPPRIGNQVGIALAVGFFELALLLDALFDGPQHINGIDAAGVGLDQRGRDAVDDKARRNPVHALALGLLLDQLDVFLPEAFDVFAIVELQFLE